MASGAGGAWRRWIDTSRDSPHDIVDWERAPLVPSLTYRTEPRSVVVLFAENADTAGTERDLDP